VGPYVVGLPFCMACADSGCHIIVRAARANAKAVQARLDRENAREAAATATATSTMPISDVPSIVVPIASVQQATSVSATATTSRTRTRSNKRTIGTRMGGKRTRRCA